MFQECGVTGRQRKLNRRMLVRAMIISGGTPGGSYRADILRSSLEFAVAEVVHLGFYPLFDEPLDQSMVVLVQLAMNHAWARQVDLSDPLAGVTNQDIFDSVTVKVQEVLLTDFHLSESYIRVHKALSVPMPASTAPGPANPIAYG